MVFLFHFVAARQLWITDATIHASRDGITRWRHLTNPD